MAVYNPVACRGHSSQRRRIEAGQIRPSNPPSGDDGLCKRFGHCHLLVTARTLQKQYRRQGAMAGRRRVADHARTRSPHDGHNALSAQDRPEVPSRIDRHYRRRRSDHLRRYRCQYRRLLYPRRRRNRAGRLTTAIPTADLPLMAHVRRPLGPHYFNRLPACGRRPDRVADDLELSRRYDGDARQRQ